MLDGAGRNLEPVGRQKNHVDYAWLRAGLEGSRRHLASRSEGATLRNEGIELRMGR